MKKLLLFVTIAVFGFSNIKAQEFNVGISGVAALAESVIFFDVAYGVNLDVNYLWKVSDKFQAGVTSGYSHVFGPTVRDSFLGVNLNYKLDDTAWLPVALAARFNILKWFTIGGDVGYAVGISPEGFDGGFYYAPKAQYRVSKSIDIVTSYRQIEDDGSPIIKAISLGVEFGF